MTLRLLLNRFAVTCILHLPGIIKQYDHHPKDQADLGLVLNLGVSFLVHFYEIIVEI